MWYRFLPLKSCKSTSSNIIIPTNYLYGIFDSEDEQELDKKLAKNTLEYTGCRQHDPSEELKWNRLAGTQSMGEGYRLREEGKFGRGETT